MYLITMLEVENKSAQIADRVEVETSSEDGTGETSVLDPVASSEPESVFMLQSKHGMHSKFLIERNKISSLLLLCC